MTTSLVYASLHPTPSLSFSLQLQRLKRSLSFKSVMRSKSVDNFFQRNGDSRPPPDLITPAPLPSLSPSASPNPSLSSHSPSVSPSIVSQFKPQPKSQVQPVQPMKPHCFQEHVFRRATNCHRCKHAIQGNSKQGLRCKACKLAAHLWCSSELSQQPCTGKICRYSDHNDRLVPVYALFTYVFIQYSHEEGETCVLDPVYEALRYGTSLAQMSRSSFSSISESPCHEVKMQVDTRRPSVPSSVHLRSFLFCSSKEKLLEKLENQPIAEEESIPGSELRRTPKRVEVHSVHTYVALYKFLPQEKNDLELHPGDRIQVTDDANEDWWKGKIRDKVGFFPANFVQRVRPGERVWKVTAGFHGNREKGQMSVKEAQICVGKNEEIEGFLRMSSGKKRGMVPVKNLMEI
uniref:SH3 and cysteine-rich domain-containing protein 2 n=1 Tax=Neogobius melanostomus TaxID=47308 RepID=A0A8C6TM34_9GOBI